MPLYILIIFLFIVTAGAQNPYIIVLGSSTAYGTGPSDPDNAWVNRYTEFIEMAFPGYTVYNLAVPGQTTYHIMPDDYEPPANRPSPNPGGNITLALSVDPTAIIINLPSNDAYYGYSVAEQLANYDTILALTTPLDIPVWISTTQPRNLSSSGRQNLMIMRDSTFARFDDKAIDFWNGLAETDGTIIWYLDAGDGVHLNDDGHEILYNRVIAASAGFPNDNPLPVVLSSFTAFPGDQGVILRWITESELLNDSFIIEKKMGEEEFNTLTEVRGNGSTSERSEYEFLDEEVLSGQEYFYRLSDRDYYGNITVHSTISVIPEISLSIPDEFKMFPAYPNPFNSSTNIPFFIPSSDTKRQTMKLVIYNMLGQEVYALYEGPAMEGENIITWDGRNKNGDIQPSGVYIVYFLSAGYITSEKIILMK